jgi:ribosomal protein S18 acetylase RimI-like enzyme
MLSQSHTPYSAMSDLPFEQAKPRDLVRLMPLIEAYYKFEGIPFQSDRVQRALQQLLETPTLGRVWIISSQAKDVGYVILTFGYDLEFGGRQATITDFYIAPACRRKGLGTRMMQFVESVCRELQIGALELQVERDNLEARAFYRKLGFKTYDRIPLAKALAPGIIIDSRVLRINN